MKLYTPPKGGVYPYNDQLFSGLKLGEITMKKILAVLLAGLMCLFMVACAPADMERAEAKMERAGYTVNLEMATLL